MTIKDALDRAKLLEQARLAEARNERRIESVTAPVDAQPPPAYTQTTRQPAMKFDPLRVVEISPEACEKHKVLVSDVQLREFPHADAAYRLVRSRVQQRLRRNNWVSLAIASPTPNDGKTITALNLAMSVAREKQRPVYLLDLDMRNPSVCAYLGLQDVRPLTDYFMGQATPEDVLVQTSVSHLVVAGNRNSIGGASEMLAGKRLEELLSYIRMRSPEAVVLIDLPPVNTTDEALVVAPRVDSLLIVVSEGKTQRQDLARTLATLNEFTIAGVIVNNSSESHAGKYEQYGARVDHS
jgi:capsular exopolysaccharide synthesis family protein